MDYTLTNFGILIVLFYRKFISPYKGSKCPHAILNGKGNSCSDIALNILRTQTFPDAIRLIRKQLQACSQAQEQLEELWEMNKYDIEDGECCQVVLNVQEWFARLSLGDKLGWLYFDFVCVKILLSGLYHFGFLGDFLGFFFSLLSGFFIGAAGSSLWPIVLISLYFDYLILKALFGKSDIVIPVASQFILSFIYMQIDPYVAYAIMNGKDGTFINLVGFFALGSDQMTRHFNFLILFKGYLIYFMWVIIYGLIILVNMIDNWSKESSDG